MVLMTPLFCACLLLGGCTQNAQGSSCTLLVYLCGSNLETKYGSAGKNIDELLAADIPSNTNVVIQTGGSSTWRSHDIPSDKLCRYEVRDKQLVKVEELQNASMGDPATLTDFLRWSKERYATDRNMLVLWDHGGESASGICYDENYNMDCIDRDEIDKAFKDAGLGKKLNLIALDACFMASLENAAMLDDYANYLVASQEIVPTGGLDYKAIAGGFSSRDDLEFGKYVCDSFMSKCEAAGKGDRAEMALLDLSKAKDMLKAFDVFCGYLDQLLSGRDGVMVVSNASRMSAVYGAKSYANLVDMSSFVSGAHYEASGDDFASMLNTQQEFVAHEVLGRNRVGFGVSVFYPLDYKEKQLKAYLRTCPSEPYGRILSKIYFNEPEVTVSFKNAGSVDESGRFAIALAEGSERYVCSVTYTLWEEDAHGSGGYVKLGEDYDINQNWNDLTFTSDFGGTWPALQKHRLYTEIPLSSSGSAVFSMPMQVNGEKTALSTYYLFDSGSYETGSFTPEYLWGGVNEHGIPARDYKSLKSGDKVQVYAATDEGGQNLKLQDEFVFSGGAGEDESNVTYEPLPDGLYRLQMTVDDIFGHSFVSEPAYYSISEGKVALVSHGEQGA